MSDRRLLQIMLLDAIAWQSSLVDAQRGDPEGNKDSKALLAEYRAYYRKRFGKIVETDATAIGLDELRKMPNTRSHP